MLVLLTEAKIVDEISGKDLCSADMFRFVCTIIGSFTAIVEEAPSQIIMLDNSLKIVFFIYFWGTGKTLK